MELFMKMLHIAGSVLLLLFISGCATTKRIDWESRVGNYTYDAAVLEMGPPENVAELADGTKVAEWLVSRARSRAGVMVGVGPVYSGFPIAEGPDDYVRLTFGAEGRLTGWRRIAK